MKTLNFLIGLHCHQPVDNFRKIFEDAYNKSYEPFIGVLERHPKIKVSLHYSGSLLEWLVENRPDFVNRVKKLIHRGQVEILTGGYFEPIFPMIPARDAKGQVEMLTRSIEIYFDFKACGIWLAERLWDPAVLSILKDLNVRYTILDDSHLECSGIEDEDVFGYYSIKGFVNFFVFASIKKLRYTMPFREPEVTVNFLKNLSEKSNVRCVTFADDCEKFGFWPYTYNWVYKKGWLEKFFASLERSDWIRTLTFSEALEETQSLGEAEIPHSSYAEMMQWCNGNFNNFFTKYPESNLARKRMLYVSNRLEGFRENTDSAERIQRLDQAEREVYKSQSNCAYWHGVFGGVYVNYLRQGVYSHIIKADNLLRCDDADTEIEMMDFSTLPAFGGRGESQPKTGLSPGLQPEVETSLRLEPQGGSKKDTKKSVICAQNKFLALFIDPDYAGAVFEIDYKPLSYNLVNTMSRHIEPYHEKLKMRPRICKDTLKRKVDKGEPIDLYEVLGIKERNLRKFLNYDSYRKFLLLCHVMNLRVSLADFIRSTHTDLGKDSLFGPYEHEIGNENGRTVINLRRVGNVQSGWSLSLVRLNKCIILEKGPEIFIKFDLENISSESARFIFGVEFNWSIEDDAFMRRRQQKKIQKVTLVDKFCGIKINHIFEEPVNLWSFPVYTLNETEKGIGKNFQEISLLFYRKLALASMENFSLETRVEISG